VWISSVYIWSLDEKFKTSNQIVFGLYAISESRSQIKSKFYFEISKFRFLISEVFLPDGLPLLIVSPDVIGFNSASLMTSTNDF
jgi:hypothetical protein